MTMPGRKDSRWSWPSTTPTPFRNRQTVSAMQWDGTPESSDAIVEWVKAIGGQAHHGVHSNHPSTYVAFIPPDAYSTHMPYLGGWVVLDKADRTMTTMTDDEFRAAYELDA